MPHDDSLCPECGDPTPLAVIHLPDGSYSLGFHCWCGSPQAQISFETWGTAEEAMKCLDGDSWTPYTKKQRR